MTLRSIFQWAIRVALELILEEEIREMVGARRFERIGHQIDHQNGTCLRRLMTSMGMVAPAVRWPALAKRTAQRSWAATCGAPRTSTAPS